ncbi:MAG: hypothetical protein B7Y40_00815 [Gammaproteobacteria bacterium 28-57-27]|nr:MAG: hypothetical protein B7Y40_00815 [Gammaproteobacteria bacterium 28-57-27]
MMSEVYNVLFSCTGNSARSIMAEALMNHWSKGRFKAYSAGFNPRGEIHPMTLEQLRRASLSTEGLRSKSWEEFQTPDAPRMDFVITVCDDALDQGCPLWPGQPMTAHWGMSDPAKVEGDEAKQMAAFREAFRVLDTRIKLFLSLPIATLDHMRLQHDVDEIAEKVPEQISTQV